MKKIFDVEYARELAKDADLKVKLKKDKLKGVSLYASKPIKKGNIIAYYKFKVYNMDKHRQVKGGMYGMTVYTRKGNDSTSLIGDIYDGSMRKPSHGIPYWAYFSNEPSGNSKENASLDINLRGNYRNRKRVKVGDTMVYKLRASKNIKPGEEIVWCYGGNYNREYEANCDD